jgi:hypothetical protein
MAGLHLVLAAQPLRRWTKLVMIHEAADTVHGAHSSMATNNNLLTIIFIAGMIF